MHKHMWLLLLTALMASSAQAQESAQVETSTHAPMKSVRVGLGYAFAAYLEEASGSAPLGFWLSIASTAPIGIEGEVAYHRYSEEFDFFFGSYTLVLNTFTIMAGPRFASTSASAQPYGHVLFGARNDEIEGYNNWSFGGEVGGGVDIPAGSVFVRLGADFQIMFDEGENFKVLRLTGGIAF